MFGDSQNFSGLDATDLPYIWIGLGNCAGKLVDLA